MFKSAGKSISLFRLADIPVKLHWSFGLLLLFVAWVALRDGLNGMQTAAFMSYVLILFGFVIMHEYGHALMARRYGVRTRDIIISPIGGVARLESMPHVPVQELWIALAGPLVNVLLAFLFILIYLTAFGNNFPELTGEVRIDTLPSYLINLIYINVILVLFNLIPAFPMDGGRVLRALLSMGLNSRLKATRAAGMIGQLFAFAFILGGMYMDHLMIMVIGVFVFLTARQEFRQVYLEEKLKQTQVSDIFRKEFSRIDADQIISHLNTDEERNFLVFNDAGNIVGCLPWQFIRDTRTRGMNEMTAGEMMSSSFGYLPQEMNIMTAFHVLNSRGWPIAAVVDANTHSILGVIDRDLISTFLRKNEKAGLWG